MRVSYEWLNTMVDLPADVSELVAEYARTGTEVESVQTVGASLDHVVTAQIVEKKPHPDSDHMWITMVDVGENNVGEDGKPEPLQVVCGAQNFKAGDHVVTALVGAKLPGDVTIKKSKLRGVVSYGMNASERELGLGADHEGIIILPDDAPIGVPAAQYLGIADTVLDCEITPNRPDCLSMLGMARETGAVLRRDMHVELPQVSDETGTPAADSVRVSVEDPELCQRYVARVARGIKVGPSPDWLVRRLQAAGARPVNNVVDITNYVMFLTGQPLHAFDMDKLSRDEQGRVHISVRAAQQGESIVTLDGETRALTPDMALITDAGTTPIGLAGVMGGQDSQVDQDTHDILLESAAFSSAHISRTSRNLQLISEASMRYERTVDRQGCRAAADVACALLESLCEAQIAPGAVDEYLVPLPETHIELRCERLRALMGAPITDEFAQESLERLGCTLTPTGEHIFDVVPPSYRPDLPREIDLYEEVVRLWGEGDIEPTIPAARNHRGGLDHNQVLLRRVGRLLRACGLSETINYNFSPANDMNRVRMDGLDRGQDVRLMTPMSEDMAVMRRSLIPGLLRNVAYNQSHGVPNVALYEVGRLFFGRQAKAQPRERTFVAGVLAGSCGPDAWSRKASSLDFFDAKGVVESLLEDMRVAKVRFTVPEADEYPFAQPGRVARVMATGRDLGWVAELHPQVVQDFDAKGAVAAFELDLDGLLDAAQAQFTYHEVPQLPAVEMDLALVVDKDVSYERVMQAIRSAGGKHLDDARLFDLYTDEDRLGPGKKQLAF